MTNFIRHLPKGTDSAHALKVCVNVCSGRNITFDEKNTSLPPVNLYPSQGVTSLSEESVEVLSSQAAREHQRYL